ncbi:MAG: nucleoside phosphorylase [Aureispira sp.]|nr:nucleoside phosphorylase [Aureispira sp.]
MISDAELILNPDKSIYHLNLKPEHIAPTVITVGDPNRVAKVSKYFDEIEFETSKREFVTHTGRIGDKRLTVISTGIGTDNIDIVLTELDALVNIDFDTRQAKTEHTSLDIIRIGTSGGLGESIPLESFVVSEYAVGIDGLMLFYQDNKSKEEAALLKDLSSYLQDRDFAFPIPLYVAKSGADLSEKFSGDEWLRGITITAPGFYAPQNRYLRALPTIDDMFSVLDDFSYQGMPISNLEMETSGIYGLANTLGHQALSLNGILANRATGGFVKDPYKLEESLIKKALEIIVA